MLDSILTEPATASPLYCNEADRDMLISRPTSRRVCSNQPAALSTTSIANAPQKKESATAAAAAVKVG